MATTLLLVLLLNFGLEPPPQGGPHSLRTEYHENPAAIDTDRPRFSWKLAADGRGVVQTAFEIQVARTTDDARRGRRLTWQTGKVDSDQSIHVEYAGPALQSGDSYAWRVRTWNGQGVRSEWSEPATFGMGLLAPNDWGAPWITPVETTDPSTPQPAPMLRHEFRVDGRVRSARAFVSGVGLYEMELNGRVVGDEVFTPGWTAYRTRVQYQAFDVTNQLVPGANAVGAILGDGWYKGTIGWVTRRNAYGNRAAFILRLVITYTDGRTQVVTTGPDWKASIGPTLFSDIYNGEGYDARLEKTGWSRAGFDDSNWGAVETIDLSKMALVAPAGPPVRRIQELKPVRIFTTPGGDTVADFGQNMVGRVRLRVTGPAGTTVRLRHIEVLDKDGNVYTANLRAAKQLVEYTLKGGGEEVYEPRFTFQGFQFVVVEGWPGELTPESLTGIVIHSDMDVTGSFDCSNPLLNQLQHNILWGQKGNFLDVPTDCPQRDERLGWTGDAHVFSRTAAFNMDVAGFYTKWLRDVAADQKPDGSVPWVIPDVLSMDRPGGVGSTAWADAAVVIPWNTYLAYGDRRILEVQYPSMKGWVDYVHTQAPNGLWVGGTHFGDWLAFATTNSDYPGATTGKDLIATAFFAFSTDLVAKAAAVLGHDEDAATYEALFGKISEAFNHEFVTPSGRVAEGTQTAYTLALQFGLLPDTMRTEALGRLAADVENFGHLTTGFVGTSYLPFVLTESGRLDVAYRLLNRTDYPSWLYPVTKGATTIWERWDGLKPDGTFQDPGMNSFNHYAYGAVGDWMYRVVAGLDQDPLEPGYKRILVKPRPGGGLTHARATLETMYGTSSSGWRIEGETMTLEVTIPPNTTATVVLPGASLAGVSESGSPLAAAPGVTGSRQEGPDVALTTGSGTYSFTWTARPQP